MESHPKAALKLFIVWTFVLATDDASGVEKASGLFSDARVVQFHDSERFVGRALAPRIGMPSLRAFAEAHGKDLDELERVYQRGFLRGEPSVFDTVLFFAPQAKWDDEPPHPKRWVTQLDPAVYIGIDEKHHRYGKELLEELKRLTTELVEQPGETPPK